MKKIGFVYKYNPLEEMGILVFGTWKEKSGWGITIKNTPILFSASDLLSEVISGCLVYFDLNDNKASNIERASLSNFKIDFINSIVRCGERESEHSFYSENTMISFECLETIILPEEKEQIPKTKKELSLFQYDSSVSLVLTEFDAELLNAISVSLPESINDLFNCFGKYKHRRNECITIDIFDLSLWVDQDVLNDKYYGMTVEELKFLYDIFVMRIHYDRNGNVINCKPVNNVISSKWSLLLSRFSESELQSIRYLAPKLQPAFPKGFCKKNAGLLTDDYGMPDVEICKLYCLQKISNAETVSEYKDIKHRLFVYCYCGAKHLEGEGTPMCKMGKRRITNLEKILEERYETVIKPDIIAQIKLLSVDDKIEKLINSLTPDEFNNVGLCLERFNKLRVNFLGYKACEKALNSFNKLPQLCKDALKTSLLKCANESAISSAKSDHPSPFIMGYNVEQFGDWILDSTKQKIKELVNDRFSNLDDLEELSHAYKYDYITDEQYYNKYVQLTCDYNSYQFLKELSDFKNEDYPLNIQWYVVSNIIKQLGYKSLDSYKYVKLDYYDSIFDIKSLLAWLKKYSHLNDNVLKKAEEKICSVLSNDERWILYEEKIVESPGIENIRKKLDEAYNRKSINQELLKNTCFQDIMMSDVDNVEDPDVLLFIADNLDSHHQYLMQQKATGFMKLYLWQKQPSGSFEWNLVKSHFHELPVEAQIRTLRYIFRLMALGESTLLIDDLYSEFVKTSTPACSAICGILYILKTKKDDLTVSITPAMVESAIGEDIKHTLDFLKDSKILFYPCYGYLAITQNQRNFESQSFNGILTKENKNDAVYYAITFYESPVNLFGRTVEWLDSKEVDIAEQVLIRNADVEIVNGKYYIPESQEFYVKQFVITYDIDDKCGLLSEKGRLIELGFLPKNSAFQPLYTNGLRKYEDSDHYICRCGCEGGSDPRNSFPFFWCKKKICARRGHFLLPPSQWENFRFADLLFIVLGQTSDIRESVWRVNEEISQFICDYAQYYNPDAIYLEDVSIVFGNKQSCKPGNIKISSSPLIKSEDLGVWDKDSSTYRLIYDDEYDDGCDNCDDCSPNYDEPTYDRYNGSYAQDVMGYSDDDIDTIFEGDPDAYWNID